MSGSLTLVADGLSVPVYLALAVLAASRCDGPRAVRRMTVLACLATLLWAGIGVMDLNGGTVPLVASTLAGLLRTFAWLALLAGILDLQERPGQPARRRLLSGRILWIGAALVALAVGLAALPAVVTVMPVLSGLSLSAPLIAAVAGLVLAEKAYVRSGPSGRWALKYMIIALVTVFGFDLYVFADALLLNRPSPDILAARALIAVLVAPLLGLSMMRMDSWVPIGAPTLSVSRTAVLHGVALLGSGLYLLAMAAIAYFVRESGGQWGGALQITFLVGGFVLMFAVLASGRFISWAKIYLHKAFFTYKYDYREEWRRFIGMMSSYQSLTLSERIVHTLATMMDSPSGALWVWQAADEAYVPAATWNYHGVRPSEQGRSAFVTALKQQGWIVEITGIADGHLETSPPIRLPPWLADRAATWLVVPLAHRGEMVGLLILDRARAPRRLDWEDRDLLKTAAAHAASYLAEDLATKALDEAQKFEDFNRRFAFVAHDLKNIVGQMSLMIGNAERFGENPEFRRDMIETVRNSTVRMKGLLDQLTQKRRRPVDTPAPDTPPPDIVPLGPVIAALFETRRKTSPQVVASLAPGAFPVRGDREGLVAILDHLIDNALEAIAPSGQVEIGLRSADGTVIIEVTDNGKGMDAEFARTELFRPLRSTKAGGYGIGAFQTRHMIREMGGQLEVDSVPNRGTTMRILFPIADIEDGAREASGPPGAGTAPQAALKSPVESTAGPARC